MFYEIEKKPQNVIDGNRIDFLYHYITGRFERETLEIRAIFCSNLSKWIYEWLLDKGYKVDFSYYWYKMIYLVTNDDDDAWNLFYNIFNEYLLELSNLK